MWSVIFFLLTCIDGKDDTYIRHTNNWAVLVDTSRFWFNYRHISNTLSLYHSVKRLGIPDSHIVLMLADQMPCNARNCYKGQVFGQKHGINLYGTNVEVDYRGTEVSVANFIKVLTGRHTPGTPASQRLDTNEQSNVFIFMTGHGGEEFLKFQDAEEIASQDISDAIQEMHVKKRYKELFFMVDTCQAGSLANSFASPNVLAVGSSMKGENSYAKGSDTDVGVSLIDRFTSATLDFLEKTANDESTSIEKMVKHYNPRSLLSTPDWKTDLFKRSLDHVPITDFLGSILHVRLNYGQYPYTGIVQKNDKKSTKEWTSAQTPLQMEPISTTVEESVFMMGTQVPSRVDCSYMGILSWAIYPIVIVLLMLKN